MGLHPDQATGAIVDCGLVLNKPWAVVPCCVFPSLFPARARPGDGTPVRTTEALVEHLMARATTKPEPGPEPGAGAEVVRREGSDEGSVGGDGGAAAARRCELPCEGASTAVWWCPPPSSSAAAAAAGTSSSSTPRGRVDWPWPNVPASSSTSAGGSGVAGPFQLPSKKKR